MPNRRYRLTSRKGQKTYLCSVNRRIRNLNESRLHRHKIHLRRSGRLKLKCSGFPPRILAGDESGLQVHDFGEPKGRGIVASRTFSEKEVILEYCGDFLSGKEGLLRYQNYPPEIGSYMFFFTHKGSKYCIDATQDSGRVGRLANHSRRKPNCIMKCLESDKKVKLILFALKTIYPGDEILYDYGETQKGTVALNPWLLT